MQLGFDETPYFEKSGRFVAHMAIYSQVPTFFTDTQKIRFQLAMEHKLHLAPWCGWDRELVCQPRNVATSTQTAKSTAAGPETGPHFLVP